MPIILHKFIAIKNKKTACSLEQAVFLLAMFGNFINQQILFAAYFQFFESIVF